MLLAQIKSNYSSGDDSSSDGEGGDNEDKKSKKVKKEKKDDDEEEEEDGDEDQEGKFLTRCTAPPIGYPNGYISPLWQWYPVADPGTLPV